MLARRGRGPAAVCSALAQPVICWLSGVLKAGIFFGSRLTQPSREPRMRVFGGRPMKLRLALVAALLCVGVMVAEAAQAERSPGATEKTARIAFVREFVREMEVLYRLQETAKKEFAEDSSATGKLTTSIRVGTRTLFEMQESVSRLNLIGLVLAGESSGTRSSRSMTSKWGLCER
jgi:hypothetical protein